MAQNYQSHRSHDLSWSFCMPYQEDAICFACTVETLEEEAMLLVKKSRALAELSSLLQLPVVIQKLECNSHIVSHVVLVLLELMKTDDKEFFSSVIEVFMKLMLKMDSEELVMFVVNLVKDEVVSNTDNHRRSLYLYLTLGKLVQSSSTLVHHIQKEGETLLRVLYKGLECPDEEVQSAVAFIMAYILTGPWETILSHVFLCQLSQEIIGVLNSGKSQALMLNALVVLKKLVESDDVVYNLMKLKAGKDTIMSVLKKLIISKNSEYQMTAIGILSCIVNKKDGEHCVALLQSDLVEFIFEAMQCRNVQTLQSIFKCLKPLCVREEFYSQCHSVYGIESVLRCFTVVADMKNFELMEEVFIILSIILENQPDTSLLFINSSSVMRCLDTIGTGIAERNHSVFCAASSAFKNIFRKEHLLKPVPFEKLQSHLVMLSSKLWQQVFVGSLQKSKSKAKKPKLTYEYNPVEIFLEVCLASFQLLEECMEDPAACQSNYESPTKGENSSNSLAEFEQNLHTVCSESAIPVSLDLIERETSETLVVKLLKVIQNLEIKNSEKGASVIHKLMSAGFLSKILEYKRMFEGKEVEAEVNAFIVTVLRLLLSQETTDFSVDEMPDWIPDSIQHVEYPFSALPQVMSTLHLETGVLYIYLFLLSYLYQMDEGPLKTEELFVVIELTGNSLSEVRYQDIPTVVKRALVFLWAYAECLEDRYVDKSCAAFQVVVNIVTHDPPEKWYTHHLALIYWTYRDSYICDVAGNKIITEWLRHLSEIFEQTDLPEWMETTDSQLVLEMFTEEKFTKIFLGVFANATTTALETAYLLFDVYLDSALGYDGSADFINLARNEIKENLDATFVHSKDKETNLECQLTLLHKLPGDLDLDNTDIKLAYHVMKWIVKNKESSRSMEEACLQMLCKYARGVPIKVIPLLLQNSDMISALDHHLRSGSVRTRSRAADLLTQFLHYCHSQSSQQTRTALVSLDIHPLEKHLLSEVTWETQSYLHLLTAWFHCQFVCPLVKLQHTGRNPADPNCPLVTQDFRILFVYLQQNVLQDASSIKMASFECLLSLLDYLKGKCPSLAEELLSHPWNSLLIEVLCQTTEIHDESTTLINEFITKVKLSNSGGEIFKNSENLQMMVANFEQSHVLNNTLDIQVQQTDE